MFIVIGTVTLICLDELLFELFVRGITSATRIGNRLWNRHTYVIFLSAIIFLPALGALVLAVVAFVERAAEGIKYCPGRDDRHVLADADVLD